MISSPFKSAPTILAVALGAFLLPSAGCSYPDNTQPGYATPPSGGYVPAPEPGVPTSLVVVVEGESTAAEYEAHRREIIAYLIDRGYINSESDLVADPDDAERIIRAIVSGDGFTISVFDKNAQAGPPPDLEDSDLLYPADPYFIWGFLYAGEIGLRHLPPRPSNYRPHPWPLHHGPPPGHPIYDQNRHWSHSNPSQHNGQPHPSPEHVAPGQPLSPSNQRSAPGPHPIPERSPGDNRQTHPDEHNNSGDHNRPDDHGRPANNDHPAAPNTPPARSEPNRPEDHSHATQSQPVSPQSQAVNGQHGSPPVNNSSRNNTPMPPHQGGPQPSHSMPPPRSSPPPVRSESAPVRSAPPPAEHAPASSDDKDPHRTQN